MQMIKNAETLGGVHTHTHTHTHTDNLVTRKNKLNKAIQINLKKCKF